MDDTIKFLLNYVSNYPEVYNKVANILYTQFGIRGAEICLLCTFIAVKFIEERKKENEETGKEKRECYHINGGDKGPRI